MTYDKRDENGIWTAHNVPAGTNPIYALRDSLKGRFLKKLLLRSGNKAV